jgi:succinate dehydrogenase/fumarate reductase cytochrome b subunit
MDLQKLFIVGVFVAVLYNLGAALYYMMNDKGQSSRMARSLSWRIGLSVGLIALVVLGILTGVIKPPGIIVGH